MPFCSNCGFKLSEESNFCPKCGEKVVKEEAKKQNFQREHVFDGVIHKCPSCGETLRSFTTVCPSCGYEIRGNGAAESVKDLHANVTSAKTEYEKIQYVKTFPVPTSKEDIYELMILASTNFDENYYVSHKNKENLSDAWHAKIEQCYQKAKFSLSGTSEFQEISNIYNSVKQRIAKAELNRLINIVLPVICIAIGLALIMTEVVFLQTIGLVGLGTGIFILYTRKKSQDIFDPKSDSIKSGFSSWSTSTKALWILLNIYTLGIPAIIYAFYNKNH